jgi:hypothetical protein
MHTWNGSSMKMKIVDVLHSLIGMGLVGFVLGWLG